MRRHRTSVMLIPARFLPIVALLPPSSLLCFQILTKSDCDFYDFIITLSTLLSTFDFHVLLYRLHHYLLERPSQNSRHAHVFHSDAVQLFAAILHLPLTMSPRISPFSRPFPCTSLGPVSKLSLSQSTFPLFSSVSRNCLPLVALRRRFRL